MGRYTFVFFCALGAVLSAGGSMGQTGGEALRPEVQENFQQLVETNSCPGCDLSGAVFNRLNLSGANLEGANLAGTQLYLTNLSGANLSRANLQGAALGGADLAGADLTGANLTGAVLEGAYLVGAKMDGQVVTRRPYVEEGGPEAGELIFVGDEDKSKSLPFTNQATVAGQESPAVAKPPAPEPAVPEEQIPAPGDAAPAAEETVAPSQPEQIVSPDLSAAPAEESKKLVVIAEPVLPASSVPGGQGQPESNAAATPDELRAGTANTGSAQVENDIGQPAEADVPAPTEAEPTVAEEASSLPGPASSDASGVVESTLPEADKTPLVDLSAPAKDEPAAAMASDAVTDGAAVTPAVPESRSADPVPASDAVIAELPVEEVDQPMKPVPAKDFVQAEESLPAAEVSVAALDSAADAAEVPAEQEAPAEKDLVPMTEEVDEPVGAAEAQPVAPVIEEVVLEEKPDPALEQKKKLVEKLLDDNRCVDCDLSGVDLAGRRLKAADLERVNLQGAHLQDTNLQEANLKGADLRGADLRGADLREADLYRANLSGADLTGARFEEALIDLIYADDAVGANFEGALQGD